MHVRGEKGTVWSNIESNALFAQSQRLDDALANAEVELDVLGARPHGDALGLVAL